MARPKNRPGVPTAKQRLDAAFWEQVVSVPFEQITVRKVAESAGLNRGTFYYYYADVYEALDVLVEGLMPKDEIRRVIREVYFGRNAPGLLTEQQIRLSRSMIASKADNIDRICELLNSHAAPRVSKILKDAIAAFWEDEFGFDMKGAGTNVRFAFEFFANGLFGILAYRAELGNSATIESITEYLIPEMPEMFSRILAKSMAREAGQA